MQLQLHKNARTTPAIRAEIRAFQGDTADCAKQYGISWPTANKWRNRETVNDLSHTPHQLKTTLNSAQEELVLFLRKTLRIGLDDLLAVAKEFIEPQLSRSALARLLKRRGAPSLQALAEAERKAGVVPTKKKFKDYEPGYIHIDIKYLPKLEGEKERQYLFVAIDRCSRWVFSKIYDDQSDESSVDFIQQLRAKAPMTIKTILTDNGTQFTDRFSSQKRDAEGNRVPTGNHAFDQSCQAADIEHRLIPPRHPQTNGMVERFNGRVSEVLRTHHFDSKEDLKETLERYCWLYNNHLPQKALGHVSPVDALKVWQKKQPKLFVKKVYKLSNHTGCDKRNVLWVPTISNCINQVPRTAFSCKCPRHLP